MHRAPGCRADRRCGARSRVAPAIVVCIVLVTVFAPPAQAATPEWNIGRIGAPAPGGGVVVAVVDTGVDATHPTFGGRVLPTIDLVGGPAGDPNGHGTHVAGTVGGGATGPIIGTAPGTRILPVRVLGADGSGSLATVNDGIRRAADAGATVINLSLGDDVVIRSLTGSGLTEAIEYAWAKGSIPVLAAGNDGLVGGLLGSGYGRLPAVVVTATGPDDRVAPYATSVGSARWGIAAPGGRSSGRAGEDILSARPGGGYRLLVGTSMAAPHVSGALVALRATGLGPQQAVDRLLATARPVGPRSTYGAGLVDLAAALRSGPSPAPTHATAPPAQAGAPAPASTVPAPTTAPTPATSAAPPTSDPAAPDEEEPATTSEPAPEAPLVRGTGEMALDPVAGGRLRFEPSSAAAAGSCLLAWALLGGALRRRLGSAR